MYHPKPDEAVPDETSDLVLAERAGNGDREAFEQLVRRYNQRLYRVARSILKENAAAQDALQEAYVKIFNHIGSFEGPEGLSTWLYTVVRNEALMQLRAATRHGQLAERVSALEPVVSAPSPDDAVSREEMASIADRCVDSLPDDLRTAFVLRGVESLSVNETAHVLGVTEATVKMRTLRARKLLRSRLDRRLELAGLKLYEFAGRWCDALTGRVLARISTAPANQPGARA